jgi:hypothetical protein
MPAAAGQELILQLLKAVQVVVAVGVEVVLRFQQLLVLLTPAVVAEVVVDLAEMVVVLVVLAWLLFDIRIHSQLVIQVAV